MDHSRFIESVVGAGLVIRDGLRFFTDDVISRWLLDNIWVESPTSRCEWCQHMKQSGFSEAQCRLNVTGGGSCYRETLRTVFIPFLKNAQRGIYPSPEELQKEVHRKGPIWDGTYGMTLIGMILHELGGTFMRMDAEEA